MEPLGHTHGRFALAVTISGHMSRELAYWGIFLYPYKYVHTEKHLDKQSSSKMNHKCEAMHMSGPPLTEYHSNRCNYEKITFFIPNRVYDSAELLAGEVVMDKILLSQESHIEFQLMQGEETEHKFCTSFDANCPSAIIVMLSMYTKMSAYTLFITSTTVETRAVWATMHMIHRGLYRGGSSIHQDSQHQHHKHNQNLLCQGLQEGVVQGDNGLVRCGAPQPPGTGHPSSIYMHGEWIVHEFLHHQLRRFITQAIRFILLKLISMHYNPEDWFDNAMLADNTNINVMHSFPDFMVFTFATLVMFNVDMATVDICCLDSATTRSVCRLHLSEMYEYILNQRRYKWFLLLGIRFFNPRLGH